MMCLQLEIMFRNGTKYIHKLFFMFTNQWIKFKAYSLTYDY